MLFADKREFSVDGLNIVYQSGWFLYPEKKEMIIFCNDRASIYLKGPDGLLCFKLEVF